MSVHGCPPMSIPNCRSSSFAGIALMMYYRVHDFKKTHTYDDEK